MHVLTGHRAAWPADAGPERRGRRARQWSARLVVLAVVSAGSAFSAGHGAAAPGPALPAPPAPPPVDAAYSPPLPASDADWLTTLDYYRALAGAAPVTEDPRLSAGDAEHARYTLDVGVVAHNQDAASIWRSSAGLAAARNSNGYGGGGVVQSRTPIDAWVSSIGHGLPMLRASYAVAGYALANDPSRPLLKSTAWLDVYSGPERSAGSASIRTMPIDQAVISATTTPVATEHVVATCPGYSVTAKLPLLWVWVPRQPGVATVEVRRDGVIVPSCSFSGANYTNADATWGPFYRDALATTSVVGIVIGESYRPGAAYSVALRVPAQDGGADMSVAWSYRVAGGTTHDALPTRLFDTRDSEPDGAVAVPKDPAGPWFPMSIQVGGVAGVPSSGVTAVSLNLTATEGTRSGFVTVYPCGVRPLASNLNFDPGQTVSNAVLAPLSVDGKVCLFASQPTELVADITGWFGAASAFVPVAPQRLADSRPTEPQGAVRIAKVRYGGGAILRVRVAGAAGLPQSGIGAVALNVTVVGPSRGGFVTAYPCGEPPLASSLNYAARQTVGNAVITRVSDAGEVCFSSLSDTDLVVDVNGWFAVGGDFVALDPLRLVDTRTSEPDGAVSITKQRYWGHTILDLNLTGVAGFPSGRVEDIALTVIAVDTGGPGFVTVFPCGAVATISSLNYAAGTNTAGLVVSPVSASGHVCFSSLASTDLVVDVQGWFVSPR